MAENKSGKVPHKTKIIKIGSYHVGKTIGKGMFAVVKMAEHHQAKVKVYIFDVFLLFLTFDILAK